MATTRSVTVIDVDIYLGVAIVFGKIFLDTAVCRHLDLLAVDVNISA